MWNILANNRGGKIPLLRFVAALRLRAISAVFRNANRKPIIVTSTAATPGVVKLAIMAGGGIGDLVVLARYLRDLYAVAGPLSFDVFVPYAKTAAWLLRNVPGVSRVWAESEFRHLSNRYDLQLFVAHFVQLRHSKLPENTGNSRLREALEAIAASNVELRFYIDHHPETDGFLSQKLQFRNLTRSIGLQAMSGIPYGGDRLALNSEPAALSKHNLQPSAYVTVHNGFELQHANDGEPCTKYYPHLNEVVLLLRRQFPHLRFVQLGSHTSTPIQSVHLNLIGQTTIEEASTIIAGSLCHLDNESGLVHIASCHGVPSCVVFGPTPSDYFAYSSNISVRPLTCGGCWWITKNWMAQCPRGFKEPVCTYSQTPEAVAKSAATLILQTERRAEPAAFKVPAGHAHE